MRKNQSVKVGVVVKKNKTLVKVPFDEICFIESMKDYVKIHTTGDTHFVKHQISALEEELPESQFIRVHKSYIIPVSRVTTISLKSVGIGEDKIPIGRNYKEYVLKKLNYFG